MKTTFYMININHQRHQTHTLKVNSTDYRSPATYHQHQSPSPATENKQKSFGLQSEKVNNSTDLLCINKSTYSLILITEITESESGVVESL